MPSPLSVGVLTSRTILSAEHRIIPSIEIGTSGVIFTTAMNGTIRKEMEIGKIFAKKGRYPLTALEPILKDCDFRIESIDGEIKTSMVMLDSQGHAIARLVRNEWDWGGRPISFDRNYNSNSLEIQDRSGNIVLQVTVLPEIVRLQMVCLRKNGNRAYLVQSVGRGDAVFSFNNTANEDLNSAIRPMFRYPSELHLGQLAIPVTAPAR